MGSPVNHGALLFPRKRGSGPMELAELRAALFLSDLMQIALKN
jgi:hypothetical protein